MIKKASMILITLSLVSIAYSIKPLQLFTAIAKCDNQTRVSDQCSTNPLNKTAYGKGINQCAEDYSKSMICFNSFSSCIKSIKDIQSNQDIPVHCWNCLVDSPAQTELFIQYQECLIKNYAYHTMGFFLVMMLVLAFIIA